MGARYLVSVTLISAALIILGAALFVLPASKPGEAGYQPGRVNKFSLELSQPVTVTATPAPTATPVPVPTPTPTPPAPTGTSRSGGLPIFPIFLAVIFLGLLLSVIVPFYRSRRR